MQCVVKSIITIFFYLSKISSLFFATTAIMSEFLRHVYIEQKRFT